MTSPTHPTTALEAAEDKSRYVLVPRRLTRTRTAVSPIPEDRLEESSASKSSSRRRPRVPRLQPPPPYDGSTSAALAGGAAVAQPLMPITVSSRPAPPPPTNVGNSPPSRGIVGASSSRSGMWDTPLQHSSPAFIPSLTSRLLGSMPDSGSQPVVSAGGGGGGLSNATWTGLPRSEGHPLPILCSTTPAPTIGSVSPLGSTAPSTANHSGPGRGPIRSTLFERRGNFDSKISLSMDTFAEELPCSWTSPTQTVFRGWSKIPLRYLSPVKSKDQKASPDTPPNHVLKIVSYNILAQHFISTDSFPSCPPMALAEDHRIGLLKEELRQADADIICLSEISGRVFASPDSLGTFLHSSLQYDGNFIANTSAHGTIVCSASPYCTKSGEVPSFDSLSSSSDSDGVSIFFKSSRFELLEESPVLFNTIGSNETGLSSEERKKLLAKSHNVGLVLVLKDLQNPKWVYVVATSHITWRSTEYQLWQVHQLAKVMEGLKVKYSRLTPTPPPEDDSGGSRGTRVTSRKVVVSNDTAWGRSDIADTHVACIFAGDFNMEPQHPGFEYLMTGALPEDAPLLSIWKGETESRARNSSASSKPFRSPRMSRPPKLLSLPPAHRVSLKEPPPRSMPTESEPNSSENTTTTAIARREHGDFLLGLIGVIDPRRVVSADNGDDCESPLKTSAPSRKPTTPPLHFGEEDFPIPHSPMKCWRSESSMVDSGLLSTTSPTFTGSEVPLTMGFAEHPVACTPRKNQKSRSVVASAIQNDLHSSVSSEDSVCPSPLPRRKNSELLTPSAPLSEPCALRGFKRRSDLKRIVNAAVTHPLRFRSSYDSYVTRHPRRITAASSGCDEGKLIDHILYDCDCLRPVSVLRLGDRTTSFPSWNSPSDHLMVGTIFHLLSPPRASATGI